MRKITLLQAFVLIFSFTIEENTFCQSGGATTLPQNVRNYLNNNYAGWKLLSVATGCSKEYRRTVVTGDFDGNAKKDYAIKFVVGRRGYIIALLDQGTDYKSLILESGSVEEMKNQGLSIARKGETYPEIVGDATNRVTRRLKTDAPLGGTCESSAYFYVYRNGIFKRAFVSD